MIRVDDQKGDLLSGLIPEPSRLLSKETSDGFYRLLQEIREADTDRELLVFMEHLFDASREYRDIFSLLEREATKKMREFRTNDQRQEV